MLVIYPDRVERKSQAASMRRDHRGGDFPAGHETGWNSSSRVAPQETSHVREPSACGLSDRSYFVRVGHHRTQSPSRRGRSP